jgi:FkbM family methyltransferase
MVTVVRSGQSRPGQRRGRPRVQKVNDIHGTGSRLQFGALRVAARLAGPPNYRGLARAAWALSRIFPKSNAATTQLANGCLRIRLSDGYWVRQLFPDYTYEPELHFILQRLLKLLPNTCFIDGGANIGLWSVVASGVLGPGKVLAIEMLPDVLAELEHNAALNGNRFSIENAALWSQSGLSLPVYQRDTNQHAGASVVEDRGIARLTVPSATLDELASNWLPASEGPLILKLDVEGSEIEALKGARTVFSRPDVVLIYEDHGSDTTHKVTRHVLSDLQMRSFLATEQGVVEITDLEQLRVLKKEAWRGYNFVACHRESRYNSLLEENT